MNYTKSLLSFRHKRDAAIQDKKKAKQEIARMKKELAAAEVVRSIVQSLSLTFQKDMHEKIAAIVTKCLQSVFDSPYEFKILFEKKRGKTEARLVFIRQDEEFDPLTECGGGVMDVAIVGLRIARLLLGPAKPRSILLMDEPFGHLDKNSPERVAALVKMLSEEFQIQIVQVTHNTRLESGEEFHL